MDSKPVAPIKNKGGNPKWKKGVSGNPGGRSKLPKDIVALARLHTKPAMKVIIGLLKSKEERIRLAAAETVLARGWGNPAQAVTGANGGDLVIKVVKFGVTDGGQAIDVTPRKIEATHPPGGSHEATPPTPGQSHVPPTPPVTLPTADLQPIEMAIQYAIAPIPQQSSAKLDDVQA